MPESNTQRLLSAIAMDIIADWPQAANPNHPAGAYAVPMLGLNSPYDTYGADSAASIVRYFLANASGWRGEPARRVKAELKSMVEGVY